MMVPSRPKKILRLRKGSRHVVALLLADGTVPAAPFWSEAQAASAYGLAFSQWSSLPTEVFAEIHLDTIPPEISIFARSTRRGRVEGAILWTKDGIFPKILGSVADAIIAAGIFVATGQTGITTASKQLCRGVIPAHFNSDEARDKIAFCLDRSSL
ncbi:hypothetical protein CFBP5499_28150 (plasmid) [Agrobacterium tumefaciens]|nr:hypothetical protein CFBP5499_28150 [Agrobacterium tumefaciens]